MRTWPGPACGSGSSTTCSASGPPNSITPTARIRPTYSARSAVVAPAAGDDVAMGEVDRNQPRDDAVEALRHAGVGRGDLVAVAVGPGVGLGLAAASGALILPIAVEDPASSVAKIERSVQPRWVMWS